MSADNEELKVVGYLDHYYGFLIKDMREKHAKELCFLTDAKSLIVQRDVRITELEAELQALKVVRHWIPVSERLPENDTPILVAYKFGGIYTCRRNVIDHDLTAVDPAHGERDRPTHWMPLPAGRTRARAMSEQIERHKAILICGDIPFIAIDAVDHDAALAAAAVVMPERMTTIPEGKTISYAAGYEAALDAVASLNRNTVPLELLDGVLQYCDQLLGELNGMYQYSGSTGDDKQHQDSDYLELRAIFEGTCHDH